MGSGVSTSKETAPTFDAGQSTTSTAFSDAVTALKSLDINGDKQISRAEFAYAKFDLEDKAAKGDQVALENSNFLGKIVGDTDNPQSFALEFSDKFITANDSDGDGALDLNDAELGAAVGADHAPSSGQLSLKSLDKNDDDFIDESEMGEFVAFAQTVQDAADENGEIDLTKLPSTAGKKAGSGVESSGSEVDEDSSEVDEDAVDTDESSSTAGSSSSELDAETLEKLQFYAGTDKILTQDEVDLGIEKNEDIGTALKNAETDGKAGLSIKELEKAPEAEFLKESLGGSFTALSGDDLSTVEEMLAEEISLLENTDLGEEGLLDVSGGSDTDSVGGSESSDSGDSVSGDETTTDESDSDSESEVDGSEPKEPASSSKSPTADTKVLTKEQVATAVEQTTALLELFKNAETDGKKGLSKKEIAALSPEDAKLLSGTLGEIEEIPAADYTQIVDSLEKQLNLLKTSKKEPDGSLDISALEESPEADSATPAGEEASGIIPAADVKKLLETADSNDDGALSSEEFETKGKEATSILESFTPYLEAGEISKEDFAKIKDKNILQSDTDGSKDISAEEMATIINVATSMAQTLVQADADSSSDISKAEYTAAASGEVPIYLGAEEGTSTAEEEPTPKEPVAKEKETSSSENA
jgi:hypothetical protein